jgi:hypothetical protein
VIYDILEGIGVEPVLANPLKTRATPTPMPTPAASAIPSVTSTCSVPRMGVTAMTSSNGLPPSTGATASSACTAIRAWL